MKRLHFLDDGNMIVLLHKIAVFHGDEYKTVLFTDGGVRVELAMPVARVKEVFIAYGADLLA